MFLLFNCQEHEIAKVVKKPIARNIFELGLSQNLLDAINLESLQVDFDKALAFGLRMYALHERTRAVAQARVEGEPEDVVHTIHGIPDEVARLKETLENFGLLSIKNQLGPVQDQSVLDKLDYTKLSKPGIKRIESETPRWDAFGVAKLENYNVTQHLFLQIYDKKAKSDITVVPLEIEAQFWVAIIENNQLKYGPT